MAEQDRYERAKKKVEDLKGFYIHLFFYIVINFALFLLNMISSPDALWFYWPLLGWGIGLVAHAIAVFGFFGMFGEEWEEKKINELMQKEEKHDQ